MLKTLLASMALALSAWITTGALAAQPAYADTCSDIQAVAQHPLAADPTSTSAAARIGARAQELYTILCPNGAVADASAPAHTPAQLGDANLASACPALTDPPLPTPGATRAQRRAQLPAFNSWASAENAAAACRHQEIQKMQRDANVYDAAALVLQQRIIAQALQMQADLNASQAAYAHANH